MSQPGVDIGGESGDGVGDDNFEGEDKCSLLQTGCFNRDLMASGGAGWSSLS